MFQHVETAARSAPSIPAVTVRERPLALHEIIAISRARMEGKLNWLEIAQQFGRNRVRLQKTWGSYSRTWANDVRLPIDVRAYHEARNAPQEDDEDTLVPRRPNLDAIYSSACNAAGGFPVLRLPAQDPESIAAFRARRYVQAAR